MRLNIFNLFKKRTVVKLPPTIQQAEITGVTVMKSLVDSIAKKHKRTGIEINAQTTLTAIAKFEQQIGFPLPSDFKEFYCNCNGFGCSEDMFNLTSLEEISKCEKEEAANGFYFAEYMINADLWGLRFTPEDKYEIFNGSYPGIAMTSSLEEFLNRFLLGNVFDKGGLYEWMEELK